MSKFSICEVCGKNEATRFMLKLGVRVLGIDKEAKWLFTCTMCESSASFHFMSLEIARSLRYPLAVVDLVSESNSTKDFLDMLSRFKLSLSS